MLAVYRLLMKDIELNRLNSTILPLKFCAYRNRGRSLKGRRGVLALNCFVTDAFGNQQTDSKSDKQLF